MTSYHVILRLLYSFMYIFFLFWKGEREGTHYEVSGSYESFENEHWKKKMVRPPGFEPGA